MLSLKSSLLLPPSLSNNLIIGAKNNSDSVQASGISQLTGLRSDDQIDFKGSNFYNYLAIGQEVNSNIPDNNTENIGFSGFIFTTNTININDKTSSYFKNTVLPGIANSRGFLFLYANKTYDSSVVGTNLTEKKYYLYSPLANNSYGWSQIDSIDSAKLIYLNNNPAFPIIKVIAKNPTECKPGASNPPPDTVRALLPCAYVYLYKELLGNNLLKTYYTYGFVYDDVRDEFIYKEQDNYVSPPSSP